MSGNAVAQGITAPLIRKAAQANLCPCCLVPGLGPQRRVNRRDDVINKNKCLDRIFCLQWLASLLARKIRRLWQIITSTDRASFSILTRSVFLRPSCCWLLSQPVRLRYKIRNFQRARCREMTLNTAMRDQTFANAAITLPSTSSSVTPSHEHIVGAISISCTSFAMRPALSCVRTKTSPAGV